MLKLKDEENIELVPVLNIVEYLLLNTELQKANLPDIKLIGGMF